MGEGGKKPGTPMTPDSDEHTHAEIYRGVLHRLDRKVEVKVSIYVIRRYYGGVSKKLAVEKIIGV